MKIKRVYLEQVIKEELQRTLEAVDSETKPNIAGVRRRPVQAQKPIQAPLKPGANPNLAAAFGTPPADAGVSDVAAGQHPIQRGEYNLKSLQVPKGNVPVFSSKGVQMGSVPVGKAPPNLIPRFDAQKNIIGYDSPQ